MIEYLRLNISRDLQAHFKKHVLTIYCDMLFVFCSEIILENCFKLIAHFQKFR